MLKLTHVFALQDWPTEPAAPHDALPLVDAAGPSDASQGIRCSAEECCVQGKNSCSAKCEDKSHQQRCGECVTQCKGGNCEEDRCRGES